MNNVDELKKLAVTIGAAASVDKVDGNTIPDVISYINDNYTGGGGDNTFIVNGQAGGYSASSGYYNIEFDKTYSEISKAVQEKKQVIVYFSASGIKFILHSITPEKKIFMGLYNGWSDMGETLYNDVRIGRLALFSESNIYFDEFTIATKSSS